MKYPHQMLKLASQIPLLRQSLTLKRNGYEWNLNQMGQWRIKYFGHLMPRANTGKDPDAGKDWRQKQVTGDEMTGWHRWLDGHEFEQTPVDSEGQGSLVCCSPWSGRVGHDWATEQQEAILKFLSCFKDIFQYNRRGSPRIMNLGQEICPFFPFRSTGKSTPLKHGQQQRAEGRNSGFL